MNRHILILSLLFTLSATTAQAGVFGNFIFIEPSVGYRSEKIQLVDLANVSSEIKTNTPSFGLKLGYRSAIGIDLNVAGEYTGGKADMHPSGIKNDFTHTSAGVQIGVNSRGLIKVFLGSTFFNEFTVKDSSALQGFKLSGPAFQAGLQFNILPYLSIGGQYTLNQFNTITGAAYAGDSRVDSYYNKLDTQDYQFYISTSL